MEASPSGAVSHVASSLDGKVEQTIVKRQNINRDNNFNAARLPQPMLKERQRLPIYDNRSEILSYIRSHQVVIVVGETGSGKTTQIPQFLCESGFAQKGCIGCTQPRRVAAITVAQRVAIEMAVPLGREVGYSVRFDEKYSPTTKIKYLTDGMLVREFMSDRKLQFYSVIILDEAHERSVHTDVLFGLIKELLRQRTDLRVVIMSATLEAQQFSSFFSDAPMLYAAGRQYPIDILYLSEPATDYLDASIVTILQIHQTGPAVGKINIDKKTSI